MACGQGQDRAGPEVHLTPYCWVRSACSSCPPRAPRRRSGGCSARRRGGTWPWRRTSCGCSGRTWRSARWGGAGQAGAGGVGGRRVGGDQGGSLYGCKGNAGQQERAVVLRVRQSGDVCGRYAWYLRRRHGTAPQSASVRPAQWRSSWWLCMLHIRAVFAVP